jgi:hypothetical protein
MVSSQPIPWRFSGTSPKAFGDHLDDVRQAMDELANRYEPAEFNRIGFRLYEKFRPDVPSGNEGWGKRAVLDVEMIRAAT